MEGWISLHRKFIDWEWFEDSNMVKLFVFLLLKARHNDGTWKGINLKKGQILTGLESLSASLNISKQTLRTCLKRLEKTGEINMQSTNKYRIITICKYDDYQDKQPLPNKQTNKQLTSNQQATNKQLTANNNGNKENNENKIIKIQNEFYQSLTPFVKEFGKETIRDFYDYWSEPNKSKTKITYQLQKTWDTKRRLKRWVKNNFDNKNSSDEKPQDFKINDPEEER